MSPTNRSINSSVVSVGVVADWLCVETVVIAVITPVLREYQTRKGLERLISGDVTGNFLEFVSELKTPAIFMIQ